MNNQISIWKVILFSLGALLVLTIGFHTILGSTPPGADHFTFWLAGRALFLEGQNPYDASVTLQSQIGIYGSPATTNQDQVAFAYPLYSLLVLLPTFWMDFPWAMAFWLALNLLIILNLFLLILPRSHILLMVSYLFIYPVAFGLILGNFAVLIGSILLLAFGILTGKENPPKWQQVILGISLAWTTAKPQFMWAFLIFFCLIIWHKQLWVMALSFLISLTAMLALSSVFVPDWFGQWIARVQQYAQYVQGRPTVTNLLAFIFPLSFAWIGTLTVILGCLIFTVWLIMKWKHGQVSELFLFAWAGFLTYFFHLHGISYEQITLVAPMICWAVIEQIRSKKHVGIFWGGFFIITWLSFAISKWFIPQADEWPVLFYAIFLIWLFISDRNQKIRNKEKVQA